MTIKDGDAAPRYAEFAADVVRTGFLVAAAGLRWIADSTAHGDLLMRKGPRAYATLFVGLKRDELLALAADSGNVGAVLRVALYRALTDARSLRSDGYDVLVVLPAVAELHRSVTRLRSSSEDDGIEFLFADGRGHLDPLA